MKVNSHVTREFGLSHSTKIQEHTSVVVRECQLTCELYCNSTFLGHDLLPLILINIRK